MRDDDYIIQIHRQTSWPTFTREIRHHQGSTGIDKTCTIPDASWAALTSAANTSDSAVFQAIAGFPGGRDLLVDIGSGGVGILRQLVLDLDSH